MFSSLTLDDWAEYEAFAAGTVALRFVGTTGAVLRLGMNNSLSAGAAVESFEPLIQTVTQRIQYATMTHSKHYYSHITNPIIHFPIILSSYNN